MILEQKRGDSFQLPIHYELEQIDETFAPINITGYTFRSQVREESSDELVCELGIVINSAAQGLATLTAEPAVTSLWPVQRLIADVEAISPAGIKTSSETIYIDVIADVTRDG
ncbi:MAG: hypothetical protein AABY68_06175 [Pseudomonadota bacterium]